MRSWWGRAKILRSIAAEFRKVRQRPALLVSVLVIVGIVALIYVVSYIQALNPGSSPRGNVSLDTLYPAAFVTSVIAIVPTLLGAIAVVLGALAVDAQDKRAAFVQDACGHDIAPDDDHHHLHGEWNQRPEVFSALNCEFAGTLMKQKADDKDHDNS